jgi:hypothetical protein
MKPMLVAVAVGIGALGGGFAVFGGYDDSPGATLLGALIVLGAMAFGAKTARSSA